MAEDGANDDVWRPANCELRHYYLNRMTECPGRLAALVENDMLGDKRIVAMTRNSLLSCGLFICVSAATGGFASAQGAAPVGVSYSRCGIDHHTESYPKSREARKAYGCRSDSAGFLEGPAQGDERGN